jgi:hypothetical protein
MSDPTNGRKQETPEQKRKFVEWFLKQQEDYFWCLNQLDIRERYRGQIVVLHNRQIIGSGPGSVEARENARQRVVAQGEVMPPTADLLLVVIPEHIWLDEIRFTSTAPEAFPGTRADQKSEE